MSERLQKLLSQWGIASRRQAETLIRAGRVSLNGAIAELGQKADPNVDVVSLDGQIISPQHRPDRHYLLMNKPIGVISTCDDPQGRPTVLDLLPTQLRQATGIHPVGRLDANSTGALLLTNDGDLTFRLTHPKHHVPKTYRVKVEGIPTAATLRRWRCGIVLSGRRTRSAQVHLIAVDDGQNADLEIVLQEGRKRQIRRVAEHLGHRVLALHRLAIGAVELGHLPAGAVRDLTHAELVGLGINADRFSPRVIKTP